MEIGKTIRELRKLKGLRQEELALASNISRTSLSQIEGGITFPHPATISSICKNLGISEAALFLYTLEADDITFKNQPKYIHIHPIIKELVKAEITRKKPSRKK